MIRISNESAKSVSSLLLTKGIINDEQLNSINSISGETGVNVLQLIIDNNYANEDQITQTISSSSSLPIKIIKEDDIDKEALKTLPNDFCRSNRLLPYKIDNGILQVAIAEHTRLSLAGNLKLIAKRPVEFSLTTFSNLTESMISAGIDKSIKDKELEKPKVESPALAIKPKK